MNIHFLHIGKTGGTAIKIVLGGKSGAYSIPLSTISPKYARDDNLYFHQHQTKLSDIPIGDKFFFCIRDVYSRFCSAFYSRKRKGRPLNNCKWNKIEEHVFTKYETPNDLVQGAIKQEVVACSAFHGISHISRKLSFWFESVEYLESRRNDILYILDQKNLSYDYKNLISLLHVSEPTQLPIGDAAIHKNRHCDYTLSESSLDFLKMFYKEDIDIIEYCNQIKK